MRGPGKFSPQSLVLFARARAGRIRTAAAGRGPEWQRGMVRAVMVKAAPGCQRAVVSNPGLSARPLPPVLRAPVLLWVQVTTPGL